jgi:hypothetical protein
MNKPLREVFLDRVIRIEAVQRERAAALWPIDTGPIESYDMERVARLSPALRRALVAAVEEWHRLVRDPRHGRLIVTGEKLGPVMTVYPDRRDIAPAIWLGDKL